MKKIIVVFMIFTLFILFYSIEMNAQVTQEWVATYNGVGVGYNTPRKSAVDKFGNYIVAGSSENSADYDYVVLKYNTSGNLLWSRRYNSPVNRYDYLTDMVLDDSGNIYVTGESQVEATGGDLDWITIKYKPNGDTAWIRSFEWTGGGPDEPYSIALDKKNNIFITGFCLASSPNGRDMVTAKYNYNGDLQWAKGYSSKNTGSDWGYAVVVDDSNNVYSSGYGSIPEGNEIVTIKYNSNGDQIWIRKFPTLGGDYLRPVKSAKDKYDNIIVNGYYYPGEQYAFNTIKYNKNGDLLWNRYYKGAGNLNFCFALCTDSSANVYVAGRNTSIGTGNDFLTIKYNEFGDNSWIRIYDGGFEQGDEVHDIIVDIFGNVYTTGKTDSLDGTANYLTMKYDSSGNIKWIKKYGIGVYNEIPYCISLDNSSNIIVSGNNRITSNNSAIRTIKYSLISDIEFKNLIDNNDTHLSNYPNPFNSESIIKYKILNKGNAAIKIYDSKGGEMQILLKEYKLEGEYELKFDAKNYSSGVYYYSLILNNKILKTNRMLLIR
ncbi:MAG: SBBP repeat-containing protein [Ignavibacteria bacterium]|nr:SBBP repeat-containing protein [Ignavibacteria bacterium]